MDIKLKRFEQDLFNKKLSSDSLYAKYGNFFTFFVETIQQRPEDSTKAIRLTNFINDKYNDTVYHDIQKQFSDLKDIKLSIDEGFKHYKYYFKDSLIPNIYTYQMLFEPNLIVTDKEIGINLASYLGAKYPYYSMVQPPFYAYQTRNMTPDKIALDALYGWGKTSFSEKTSKVDLLNTMIYHGKLMYFMEAMFPNTPDSLRFGFTNAQIKWCNENENEIWAELVSRNYLYEKDSKLLIAFNDDAPNCSMLHNEAPGRIGWWIGYKIVKKYMDENSVSLPELMNTTNTQTIFDNSKYKP